MKKFNEYFTYREEKVRNIEEVRETRKQEDIKIEKFLIAISNTLNRIQSDNPSFSYERRPDDFQELKSYTMNYKVFIDGQTGIRESQYDLTFLLLNSPQDETMFITLVNPEIEKGVESKGYFHQTDEDALEARLTEMFESLFDLEMQRNYTFM